MCVRKSYVRVSSMFDMLSCSVITSVRHNVCVWERASERERVCVCPWQVTCVCHSHIFTHIHTYSHISANHICVFESNMCVLAACSTCYRVLLSFLWDTMCVCEREIVGMRKSMCVSVPSQRCVSVCQRHVRLADVFCGIPFTMSNIQLFKIWMSLLRICRPLFGIWMSHYEMQASFQNVYVDLLSCSVGCHSQCRTSNTKHATFQNTKASFTNTQASL